MRGAETDMWHVAVESEYESRVYDVPQGELEAFVRTLVESGVSDFRATRSRALPGGSGRYQAPPLAGENPPLPEGS